MEFIHNQKIQFAAESFAHMRLVTQEMKRALLKVGEIKQPTLFFEALKFCQRNLRHGKQKHCVIPDVFTQLRVSFNSPGQRGYCDGFSLTFLTRLLFT